jgi:hypothetical protein
MVLLYSASVGGPANSASDRSLWLFIGNRLVKHRVDGRYGGL